MYEYILVHVLFALMRFLYTFFFLSYVVLLLPYSCPMKVRAVVFGGCQPDESGVFACSNDLYAYDLQEDKWDTIKPKSDADASACACELIRMRTLLETGDALHFDPHGCNPEYCSCEGAPQAFFMGAIVSDSRV